MSYPLAEMIGEDVILDTGTPVVYVGKLLDVTEHTFVLEDADMHDFRDGHVQKEQYLAELSGGEVTVNRKKVVVMRATVISVSKLSDIVAD
jgi:hypothetical protein